MRLSLTAAAVLAFSLSLGASARVARPLGRQAKPETRLQEPRMWSDRDGAFSLARPDGESWRFQASAQGPDGAPLPLLAHSEETGAQLIVQNADGVGSLRTLAGLLAAHLSEEGRIHVEEPARIIARGGEGYAFSFTVGDEARGRVAVVRSGDHVALVIASWPLGAPPAVAEEVNGMIGSLGPVELKMRENVY